MTRRNPALDTTYDTFADDSYDLSRIKHRAGALLDALTGAYVTVEIEELAYQLRELIDANCHCAEGHDDMDF